MGPGAVSGGSGSGLIVGAISASTYTFVTSHILNKDNIQLQKQVDYVDLLDGEGKILHLKTKHVEKRAITNMTVIVQTQPTDSTYN